MASWYKLGDLNGKKYFNFLLQDYVFDLFLDSISLLEKTRHKNMSSNIINPKPNKSVAPSEKVEKASENFDDIE